jgi:phosphotransferase system HPr (HPr) family protein
MKTLEDFNITPAELKAVLEHKSNMERASGREIELEEAIEDFVKNCELAWLAEKQRQDNAEQIREIEKHKYFRSKEEGYDIGRARAAMEWCTKYAPIWRTERESLERNGFLKITLKMNRVGGLHMSPASTIAKIARSYDAEVYLHRKDMDYGSFTLQGRKFINVKSVMGLLGSAIEENEEIELISTGKQAREALEAIACYINEGFVREDIEGTAGVEIEQK